MEELENLKRMWSELNDKVSALEVENRNLARKIMNEKFRSAGDRLVRKYNVCIVIEIIMICYIFLFIGFNPLVIGKYRVITVVYWFVFFLFEICIDVYLKQGVKRIDVYNSSISEISARAAKNWKLHKMAIFIGFPMALGACVLLAVALNANMFTIYGMIFGGIIGGIIGIVQLKNFSKSYRFLQSSED